MRKLVTQGLQGGQLRVQSAQLGPGLALLLQQGLDSAAGHCLARLPLLLPDPCELLLQLGVVLGLECLGLLKPAPAFLELPAQPVALVHPPLHLPAHFGLIPDPDVHEFLLVPDARAGRPLLQALDLSVPFSQHLAQPLQFLGQHSHIVLQLLLLGSLH